MLSKVPEITVWFWVIKILCTTVGESFADWINGTLGVGLEATAIIFTAVLVGVLTWQLILCRYVPFVYWLTVVVVSVAGTLYTDILTDDLGIPLAASTTVFAIILALVFEYGGAASAPCPSTASPPPGGNCSTGGPSWSPSPWAPRRAIGFSN